MKVFNSKLAAIGLAAFVFASCSDSSSDPASPEAPAIKPADITTIMLTSQQIDNSRVVNYKNSTAKARKFFGTRANGVTNFPQAGQAPTEENTKQLNNAADLTNSNYLIAGKKTLNFAGKTINGATIFIHSGSTLEYDETTSMTNTTIVLQNSATLKYTGSGDMIPAGNTVYCTSPKNNFVATGEDIKINGNFYADFRDTSTNGTDLSTGLGAIAETTAEEKKKSITPTQKITFGPTAVAHIIGSIRATELNIEKGANIYTTANVFNNGTVNIKGDLGIEGFLKAHNLNVDGDLVAGANSAIKVEDTMNVNDGANISANYINVTNNPKNADGSQQKDENGKTIPGNATLNLNGNCHILLGNKNVMNVNNLVTDNSNQGQVELADDNAVAVIKADKFVNNGEDRILSFRTSGQNASFLFQFTKSFNGSTELRSFEGLSIQATYLDYDKTTQNNLVEYKDENNRNYGYEWKGDASLLVASQKLDLIASSEDPKDGESATCIQPANGKLYVSYHTYGDKAVGGNIEVASLSGNKLTLEDSKAAANCDYNHLIVDGNKLYLAGSNQKKDASNSDAETGAIMGIVELNGSNLGTNLKAYSIDKATKGYDANCVATFGEDHVLATTNGFFVFDKDNSYTNPVKETVGKHVVTSGNKLYALTNNGDLTVYNDTKMTDGTTYAVGEVQPKGTKAVVAVDTNGDIYVCKGDNGVAKVSSDGSVNQTYYKCPTFSSSATNAGQVKGRANGIAVDANYVYLACGSYGLVVLDKDKGIEICHRKAPNGKSANYVAVDGENIYVAYGQSRIQVFKLTAK